MELRYKGLVAKVIFSPEVGSFYGEVLSLPDLIVFQASTVSEIQSAMQAAIDTYFLSLKESALLEVERCP